MKTKFFLSALCVCALGFSSCDKSSNHEEEILNSKIGVHRIEVDVKATSKLDHVAAFVGNRESGIVGSTLYSITGENKGSEYLIDTNTTDASQIVCYTEDNSINLTMSYVLHGKEGVEAKYTIKTFVNDKQIKLIEKNVKFTDKNVVESISVSTMSLNK